MGSEMCIRDRPNNSHLEHLLELSLGNGELLSEETPGTRVDKRATCWHGVGDSVLRRDGGVIKTDEES